jgi:hypothetical protein
VCAVVAICALRLKAARSNIKSADFFILAILEYKIKPFFEIEIFNNNEIFSDSGFGESSGHTQKDVFSPDGSGILYLFAKKR